MSAVKLDELIHQLENYLECWKQFNNYIVQARTKKFEQEDETQFLETKSVLTQELELILASVQTENPSKDDILALIGGTPSIRYVADLNENAIRNLENKVLWSGTTDAQGIARLRQKVLLDHERDDIEEVFGFGRGIQPVLHQPARRSGVAGGHERLGGLTAHVEPFRIGLERPLKLAGGRGWQAHPAQ